MKRLRSPVTSVTLDVRWSLLHSNWWLQQDCERHASSGHAACVARACRSLPSGRCMLRQLDDVRAFALSGKGENSGF